MVEAFKKGFERPLEQYWKEFLAQEFIEVNVRDLSPAERYKMKRIDIVLDEVESQLKNLLPTQLRERIVEEKVLDMNVTSPRGESVSLRSRGDMAAGDEWLFEFKLKKKPAIEAVGKTRGSAWALQKLLSAKGSEGPRYGLQILFYLLWLNKTSAQGKVTLLNPYWEVWRKTPPPQLRSWGPDEIGSAIEKKFGQWLDLWQNGIGPNDTMSFPFYPQEGRGERCAWCGFRRLCLKDIPHVRSLRSGEVRQFDQVMSFDDAGNND